MRCNDVQRVSASRKSEYATTEDFGSLFMEDMSSLYLLSYLLTASHENAEKCVLAGLDQCLDGNFVIREWAQSWARRTLIRNAIQMMAPHPNCNRLVPDSVHLTGKANPLRISIEDPSIHRVLALDDFERFVFVLSVLERYIDQNCAVLLGASKQKVQETRIRVLMRIAGTHGSEEYLSMAASRCRAFH